MHDELLTTMKQIVSLFLALVLLYACQNDSSDEYHLEGVWTLTHLNYPIGDSYDFPIDGTTYLNIYDGDSILYSCRVLYTASGIIIANGRVSQITLSELGNGNLMYIEDDEPRPLVVKSDSVITIQRNGAIYTWARSNDMSDEKIAEIREIIENDKSDDANEIVRQYVLSTTERKLLSTNHRLIYALIAVFVSLLITAQVAIAKHQKVCRANRRLREIEEEIALRPQPVRMALKEVEQSFFVSDYYRKLQRSITDGQRLKAEDWQEIERQLDAVYPSFTNHLLSLYSMSELEFQTSLLIKLRISPSDIANVLARDISTISSTRFIRKYSTKKAVASSGMISSCPSAVSLRCKLLQTLQSLCTFSCQ